MDRVEIGVLGVLVSIILMAMRVQIGVALGIVSFIGIALLTSMSAAWGILTAVPKNFIADWNLSAIPMFLLMGYIASRAGLTKGLFSSARIFLGHIPGGLASATVLASAMFASASGSSIATTAAFGRIAVPEMLKSNYKPSLATGCVAAAGTLGSLIPPSILMILFGIFTNTSIGALFVGGVLPGVLSAGMFIGMITIRAKLNPAIAPPNKQSYTTTEIWGAVKDTWPLPTMVVGVLGGIFAGVFTPTEAGAVGAFLALALAIIRKSASLKMVKTVVVETAEGTATVFIIAVGASMFSVFIGLTTLPAALANNLLQYVHSPLAIIGAIAVLYIILGMFLEAVSIMLLTIPIIQPILQSVGVDLLWFGIIAIKLLEIGMITPPVGMNVYTIKSALGDEVSLTDVFKGATWFLVTDLFTLVLLIAFPIITLYLPGVMQ